MGRKIFISYKYSDNNVKNITNDPGMWYNCTVRDYVNIIQETLEDKTDHIYKGEPDDEDLSQLSPSTIWKKLKNRIYDSTLTIVMLSKGMREKYKEEKHQWIPLEISYSLKEISRENKNGDPITSKTNALLAVILPDIDGSYDYFVHENNCCDEKCRFLSNDSDYIFNIMRKNMFNQKSPDSYTCDGGKKIYKSECSYMLCVKWSDFVNNMENYIDRAYDIQSNQENYIIQKEI